jgi:hypothetical protein
VSCPSHLHSENNGSIRLNPWLDWFLDGKFRLTCILTDSATFRLGAKLVCAMVSHSTFGPKVVEAIGEKAFSSADFVV